LARSIQNGVPAMFGAPRGRLLAHRKRPWLAPAACSPMEMGDSGSGGAMPNTSGLPTKACCAKPVGTTAT